MAILAQVGTARKRDFSVAVDLVASMLRLCTLVVFGASLPTSMIVVQASGTPCSGPNWSRLTVNTNVAVPSPMDNEALIQVSSSSVNPIDMDGVEPVCVVFGCPVGSIGQDVGGTVVVFGDFSAFFVGDQVWGVVKVHTLSTRW